jgi:hypothetical protein
VSRRGAPGRAAVVVCALAALVACGKRGDPLPPLRPIPARIADLAVRRAAGRVELSFTVPAANADGTTPPSVDRVDVFAASLPADAPAPTAAQLTGAAENIVARIVVRATEGPPAANAAPAAPAAATGPTTLARPGAIARVVEAVPPGTDATAEVRYYTAVPIAGTGSGRPGPASAVLPVPIGPLPDPPVGVSLTHDEHEIILSWQPAADGQRFRVFRSGAAFDAGTAELLTPEPTSETSHRLPVEFGREVCFSVVPLTGTPPVSVEGTPSPVQCVTPTDTYPPAVPAGLQAVAESAAVTLVWTAVADDDLTGYVVLRGVPGRPGDNDLQPLFEQPITATTYRDTTVQPGATYIYAVYAVDRAPAPNRSERSAPEVVTVR